MTETHQLLQVFIPQLERSCLEAFPKPNDSDLPEWRYLFVTWFKFVVWDFRAKVMNMMKAYVT